LSIFFGLFYPIDWGFASLGSFRLRGVLGLTGLDAGTDGVVEGFWAPRFGVQILLVVRVYKGVVAILADKDFVRHVCII